MAADGLSAQTLAGQQELKRRGVRPFPKPDELTRPFWDAASEGRLAVPRCADCSHWQWPPNDLCEACGSGRLAWIDLSGRGAVYSYIVDHKNLVPGFDGPYVVALVVPVEVEDDAVRLVTNLPGCDPEAVRIGMGVQAVFDEVRPGVTLPQFVPDV